MIIEEVIKAVISHPVLLSMIGPFIFGGETTLILSILAGQGFIPIWIVLIFCALGIWIADTMWFFVGKIKSFSKLKKIRFIHQGYKRAKAEIESAPSEFFLLVLIKFAYGIGIPILMYFGRKKMSIQDYLLKNTTVIAIWSGSITLVGWLIGKSSAIAFNRFENIYTSIGLIVTGLIIVHLIIKEIRRQLIKAEKRQNINKLSKKISNEKISDKIQGQKNKSESWNSKNKIRKH